MKMRNLLRLTIIASLLFVSPAGFAAEEGAKSTGVAVKPEPPTFDLSFPGGTVAEFVAHVEKAVEKHGPKPNVILPPEAGSIKMPKLELRAINMQTLMNAVSLLSPQEYRWNTLGPSTFVLVTRPDARDTRVFYIGHLLKKFKIEDLTTAIETTWQMGTKAKADLKYHQDTELLIVRADRAQLEMAKNVLDQLRDAVFVHPPFGKEDAAKPANPSKP